MTKIQLLIFFLIVVPLCITAAIYIFTANPYDIQARSNKYRQTNKTPEEHKRDFKIAIDSINELSGKKED